MSNCHGHLLVRVVLSWNGFCEGSDTRNGNVQGFEINLQLLVILLLIAEFTNSIRT